MAEIDHIFVCVAKGAPEGQALVEAGFVEGTGIRHPGQGTANRRFFFRNAMLELIWIDDEREAASQATAKTRLLDRWRERASGACPFGLCSRPSAGARDDPPFMAWEYRPAYLPSPLAIDIAETSDVLGEPMLFHLRFGRPPDAAGSPRELRSVRLTLPGNRPLSAALASFQAATGIAIDRGAHHAIELSFDSTATTVGFSPVLPLTVRW